MFDKDRKERVKINLEKLKNSNEPVTSEERINLINKTMTDLSGTVIAILTAQYTDANCKSVIELMRDHIHIRLFFNPGNNDEHKIEILKELKVKLFDELKKDELMQYFDESITELQEIKSAESFYFQSELLIQTYFKPIKQSRFWEKFWEKQKANSNKLNINPNWYENLIAGSLSFVLIGLWSEWAQKKFVITPREISSLTDVFKMVTLNPSKEAFIFALTEKVKKLMYELYEKGIREKNIAIVASVKDTIYFKLLPNKEVTYFQVIGDVIEESQKLLSASPLMSPRHSLIPPIELSTSNANEFPRKIPPRNRGTSLESASAHVKSLATSITDLPKIKHAPEGETSKTGTPRSRGFSAESLSPRNMGRKRISKKELPKLNLSSPGREEDKDKKVLTEEKLERLEKLDKVELVNQPGEQGFFTTTRKVSPTSGEKLQDKYQNNKF